MNTVYLVGDSINAPNAHTKITHAAWMKWMDAKNDATTEKKVECVVSAKSCGDDAVEKKAECDECDECVGPHTHARVSHGYQRGFTRVQRVTWASGTTTGITPHATHALTRT